MRKGEALHTRQRLWHRRARSTLFKEEKVTKNLGAAGAAKLSWDWKDDDCLRDFIAALREETGAEAVGKRLAKTYSGSFTRSAIGSGLRRKHVIERLPKLAEDAAAVLAAYNARGREATDAKREKRVRAERSVRTYRPPPPRVPEPPPAEAAPRREMNDEERQQTDAINAYFARLRP